jgi:hypothetical protein
MPFTFTLEYPDGSPAEPPTFATAVPNWSPGDAIPLGSGRTLRVTDVRPGPGGYRTPSASAVPGPRVRLRRGAPGG